MLSLAIFGGTRIDGSELEAGDRIVGVSLFGGVELDFSTTPPPPAIEVVLVSVFGGVSIKVQPSQPVRLSGFSVFGGRSVEPRQPLPAPVRTTPTAAVEVDVDGSDVLPLELGAYTVFGGISVERSLSGTQRSL